MKDEGLEVVRRFLDVALGKGAWTGLFQLLEQGTKQGQWTYQARGAECQPIAVVGGRATTGWPSPGGRVSEAGVSGTETA
jgi:hypothetical protein